MRLDQFGDTLDPDVRRERLRVLGQFVGNDADGAKFDGLLRTSIDPDELRKLRVWRHAFLGRYMHQQVVTLADMPLDEIQALVRATSDLLKAENPITSKNETNNV